MRIISPNFLVRTSMSLASLAEIRRHGCPSNRGIGRPAVDLEGEEQTRAGGRGRGLARPARLTRPDGAARLGAPPRKGRSLGSIVACRLGGVGGRLPARHLGTGRLSPPR